MKRLLIDASAVVKAAFFAACKGERATYVDFEDKQVPIADPNEAFEVFLSSYKSVLRDLSMTPAQSVIVLDTPGSKNPRRAIYGGYCRRPPLAKEWFEAYQKTLDKVCDILMKSGAIVVSVKQPICEADDIIAALASKVECTIWSSDSDMLVHADVYYKGQMNSGMAKFCELPKEHIITFKALVGEVGDGLPGCKGFGPQALLKLLETFGMDSLDDLKEMMENRTLHELESLVPQFKPLQKIIDNAETIYACYDCIKPIFPGWDLKYELRYPEGSEYLPKPSQQLITKDNFEAAKLELIKDIKEATVVALDIETDTCEESKAWCIKAQSESDKAPPVDTIGSELCGFSITAGLRTKYFSVDHADTNNISLDQAKEILNLLPEDKPIAIHNVGFELPVLRNHFELRYDRGWLPPNTVCTRILAGYVDENESSALKKLSKRWMGYDQQTYEQTLNGKSGMRELTGQEVLEYGCDDTIVTAQLYSFFELFTKYEGSFDGYEKVDQAAAFMYSEAFLNGAIFDMDKLSLLHEESKKKYAELRSKIDSFLIDLKWSETVHQPITIDMMRMMRAGENVPEPESKICRWPGCEFVSPEKESVSEVKRLYKIWKGEDLKTTSRSVGKVLDEIGLLFPELEMMAEANFSPSPEFNLRSPKQMGELLYDVLKYPVRLRNKLTDIQRSKGQREGNPSTNEDALVHAQIHDATAEEKEFLDNILSAKECLTEEGLYFSAYPRFVHWKTGAVHTSPGQSMAVTGRSTPSRPNITQMAKPSEEKPHTVREVVVVPEPDHFIVSLDFSSQELVQLAEQSGDPDMIACYSGDVRKDLHSLTGCSIYRLKYGEMSYEEFIKILDNKEDERHGKVKYCRKVGKSTNFLDAFNGSAPTLSIKLRVPLEEAELMLEAKHKAFPVVEAWKERVIAQAKANGFVVEPMGRRRHLILENNYKDNHTLRAAINFGIQAAAGSQIKCALTKIWKDKVLEGRKHNAYFLFSVHDEIVFSLHREDLIETLRDIHTRMTQPYAGFKLQFKSSIAIGKNFGELTELGEEIDEKRILEVLK